MATLREIRKQLAGLGKSLAGQKAGLSRWKTEAEKEWYKYAINSSDEVRQKVNKVISMLDDVIGR